MKEKLKFSKEELLAAINSNKIKAEEYFNDSSKLEELLDKAKQWLKKYKSTPVIGKVFDNSVAIIDLVTDYFKKEYTEIPKSSIISAIAALIYIVSPIDLVSDFIPVVGILDDVAVVTLILEFGLGNDLKKYKKWKNNQIDNRLSSKSAAIANRINNQINNENITGVFILEDLSVRVLTDSEETSEKPFECYAYLINLTEDDFTDDDIISNDDKINFIHKIFNDDSFKWNPNCAGRIMLEYKCADFDDFYNIVDQEN